jgi:L-fuculose-phosphate aldolase
MPLLYDAPQRLAGLAALRQLDALGLNRGSSGNLSFRASAEASGGAPGAYWVTPTGMPPDEMNADAFVLMSADGQVLAGDWAPSTEWPFHGAVLARRPDLHAVVHMHSPHATALACQRRRLPPFHYMVAVAGGDDVPCTPYHLFGTEALSQAVQAAFADRNACLMANHGLVAGGGSLAAALKVAIEVEALCGIYLQSLALGEPVHLSREEMAQVLQRFRQYGQARRSG